LKVIGASTRQIDHCNDLILKILALGFRRLHAYHWVDERASRNRTAIGTAHTSLRYIAADLGGQVNRMACAARLTGELAGKRMLDVGCGTGDKALFFA
jgi:2-polyprenyl-3-methyl-5-hydroxy-6-metoxy-1,4-benzoquinol methylase